MESALYAKLRENAASGDVILRRGKGPAGSIIAWYLHEPWQWSHCALIVKKDDLAAAGCTFPCQRIGFGETDSDVQREDLLVVQSVAAVLSGVNGVQLETLRGFLGHSVPGSDAVYRPLMNASVREKTVAEAAAALNEGISFDLSFRSGTRNAVYCSSFLVSMFRAAGWDGCGSLRTKNGILCFASFTDPHWYRPVYPGPQK